MLAICLGYLNTSSDLIILDLKHFYVPKQVKVLSI